MPEAHDLHDRLHAAQQRKPGALDQLLPLVYDELRLLARKQLQRLGGTPTLNATALVHEVYERLARQRTLSLDDERHFYRLCARVMRQIVIDHVRERNALKRGGGEMAVAFVDASDGSNALDGVLRISEALEQLATLDPALAETAELAWLAGLSGTEIARLQEQTVRQVQRDLQRAKAWVIAAALQ